MATHTEHIPAWKRLGLKLKSAQDVPADTETPKRKRRLEEQDTAQVKKSKTNDAISVASTVLPGSQGAGSNHPTPKKAKKASKFTGGTSSGNTTLSGPEQQTSTPKHIRRKSVTFTPETKTEDGDSIKQLFNAWVAEQKAKDPNFQLATSQQAAFETPEPPKVEETVDTSLTDKERRIERTKAKKDKKSERKMATLSQKATKPGLDPALAYLNTFCSSRPSWKFNKIHQINLIKNFYSEKSIPSSHIEQFYAYVKDLKGQARTLLRDSALKVKVQEQEGIKKGLAKMDDPEKAHAEYEAVLKDHASALENAEVHSSEGYEDKILAELSDQGMRSKVVRRIRAERILIELVADIDAIPHPQTSMSRDERKVNPVTGKVVRKRKQRTAVEISDSSSSESSDSEDEEKEEKQDGRAAPPITTTKSTKAAMNNSSPSETESSTDTEAHSDTSSQMSSDS